MKLKHFTTLIAMAAMFGFTMMAGCGEDSAEETEGTTSDTPPEDEGSDDATEEEGGDNEEEEVAADEGGGGDDSVCGRAQTCCEAYVEAISAMTPGLDVATTCGSIGAVSGTPGADGSCQTMIDGWRTSLDALPNIDTPAACAAQ